MKLETARRGFAALWFATAATVPVGLHSLIFLISPFTSGIMYRVITAIVPILAAGIVGSWLGAGILDEKKATSAIRAAGRGLAIAALSYLILFIVELIIGVIYNNNESSDEIFRLIEMIAMIFFFGLIILGWIIAAAGAAAGALLYLLRLKIIKSGGGLSPASNSEAS